MTMTRKNDDRAGRRRAGLNDADARGDSTVVARVETGRVTARTGQYALALALVTLTGLVVFGTAVLVLEPLVAAGSFPGSPFLIGLAIGGIGARIAGTGPGARFGWLVIAVALAYAGSGLLMQLSGLAARSGYLAPHLVPLVGTSQVLSAIQSVCGGLAMLLFPNGRLMRRWCWVPLVALLAANVIQLASGWILIESVVTSTQDWSTFLRVLVERHSTDPLYRTTGVAAAFSLALCGSILAARLFIVRVEERGRLAPVSLAGATIGVVTLAAALSPSHFTWIAQEVALLLFPFAAWLAMRRYRLYDIEVFVGKTVVLTLLMALLAGVTFAVPRFLSLVFVRFTGTASEVGVAVATVGVIAAFNPARDFLEGMITRRFAPSPGQDLRKLSADARAFARANDVRSLLIDFLDAAIVTLEAGGGALEISVPGNEARVERGTMGGRTHAAIEFVAEGRALATATLAARKDGRSWTSAEFALLQDAADAVASALRAQRMKGTSFGRSTQLAVNLGPGMSTADHVRRVDGELRLRGR